MLPVRSVCRWIIFIQLWINIYGLQFVDEPKDQYVMPGSSIWWHCQASSPNLVIYSWTYNGNGMSNSGPQHIVFNNGTLFINEITEANEGQYQCYAEDSLEEISSQVVRLMMAFISDTFTLHPESQSRFTGNDIILQCEVESYPPATITWLHSDIAVTMDPGAVITMVTEFRSQLTLKTVTYSDKGRYQCLARNPLTDKLGYSNTAVLTLQGGPEWVIEPSPATVTRNSIAYIHCVVEANPPATITWYGVQGSGQESVIGNNGRFVVFENGTLRITDTKEQDVGFYKCQASNSENTISKTAYLTITDAPSEPSFTSVPANTTVREGQSVSWFCVATGQPEPDITWEKEVGSLGSGRVSIPYGGALVITAVNRVDRGWYNCMATNSAGQNVHRVYLNVLYPPTIESFPPPTMLVENGDSVSLPCTIDSNPEPEIAWDTPLGDRPESEGVTISSNGTLSIQSVSPVHIGEYTCSGRNYMGQVSQTTQLEVRGSPILLTSPIDQSASLGQTLILQCEAAGFPTPLITWYLPPTNTPIRIEDGLVDDTYRVLGNGSLVVFNIGVNHEGLYRCTAENSLGVSEGTANIRVLGEPKFSASHTQLIEYLEDSVLLDCEPSGRPTPLVQWAKDGVALSADANITVFPNNSLYIASMSRSHYGTYQCFATNEVGSARLEIVLLQPDSPVFVTYPTNVTGNASQLLMIPCAVESTLTPDVDWYSDNIIWYSDGIPPYNDAANDTQRVYTTLSGILVFVSLMAADEGWYTCEANNSMGNISASIYVHVQVPPVITTVSTPKSGDVGGVTTLTCVAEGNPTPEVTWRSPQNVIITATNDYYIVDRTTLTIKVTDVPKHMGEWQCKACNMLGCTQTAIDLYVRGAPVITEVHGYMDGYARVITCKGEGTPFPEMRYYWGDLAINHLFPPRGHSISSEGPSLRILRDRIDAVSYKCRAINQYGIDTREFKVPREPRDFSVLDVGARSVLCTWTPPEPEFRGGFPELNYTIQYRHNIPVTPEPVRQEKQGIRDIPYILDGLEAYTDYTFKVASYNVLGMSLYTQAVAAKTLEAAPESVRNLLLTFSGEAIHVTWDPPAKMNGNMSNILYDIVAQDENNGNILETLSVPHGGPLETYITEVNKPYNHRIAVTVTTKNTGINAVSDSVRDEFLNKHKVPFMVPVLTRVASMSYDQIEVEWWYDEREGQEISGFLLMMDNLNNTLTHNITRVDGGHTVRSYTVSGLEERTTYAVSTAAFSREGVGQYSGKEVITTNYAVLSELPYLKSKKLALPGTTIAIILGSISGILLFLVIVLLIWQWFRLHREKRDKLVADVYKEQPRIIYPGHMYPRPAHLEGLGTVSSKKSGMSGYYDVVAAQQRLRQLRGPAGYGPDISKPQHPTAQGITDPRLYSKADPRSVKPMKQAAYPGSKVAKGKPMKQQRPKNGVPYGPGRMDRYRVNPKGQPSEPDRRRIYVKKGEHEPIMAYADIPGQASARKPPLDQNGHPGYPRSQQTRPHPGYQRPQQYPSQQQPRQQVRFQGPLTRPGGPPPRPTRPHPSYPAQQIYRARRPGHPVNARNGQRPPGPSPIARVMVRKPNPMPSDFEEVTPPKPPRKQQRPPPGQQPGLSQRPRDPHYLNTAPVSLTASQENLVNQQKRGPSPVATPPGSSRSESPLQSASSVRSARVKRPGGSPEQSPPPSLYEPHYAYPRTILNRLDESHPLPNEGRSESSTPQSLQESPKTDLRSPPPEDYIYAQPNKMNRQTRDSPPGTPENSPPRSPGDSPPSSPEPPRLPDTSPPRTPAHSPPSTPGYSPPGSPGYFPPGSPGEGDILDVVLDKKGRVYSSASKNGGAITVAKGKSGGRSHAKNLGRQRLPDKDFWSDTPDHQEIEFTTNL